MSGQLPSIEALARYELGIEAKDAAIQDMQVPLADHGPEWQSCENAQQLAFDRMDALSNLVLTLPAQTMADAIAQVGFAMGDLEALDMRVRDSLDYNGRRELDNLARAFASILRVMVDASEVNGRKLVEPWCLGQHEKWFGILDAPSPDGEAGAGA